MKSILSIIFRRRKEATIFAICILIMPLAISYIVTEKFESSASVLLTAGRFKKPFLPNEKNSQTGFIQVSMEDVASEVEILLSRPVLEKVVDENKLYIFPEPREDETLKRLFANLKKGINNFLVAVNLKKEMTDFEVAVEKLAGDVEVEYLKRTNIITIAWRGYSAEQAQQVVDSLIKEYIKHHIQVHGYASALKVIVDELNDSQQQVLSLEEKIKQIKMEFGTYDLEKERSIVLDKYIAAKARYENLLNINPNEVASTNQGLYADDPNFVSLMEALTNARLERIELLASHSAQNKRVKIKNAQISSLKSQIRKEHRYTLAAWEKTTERYKSRLDEMERVYKKISVLKRDLAGALDSYQINRQKYNEAMIAGAMDKADIASARIVSPASYTSTPAYPRKILLLIISIFFAIVGGISAAFAAEKMYSRIVNLKGIRLATGLPVLASFPKFSANIMKNEAQFTTMLYKKFATVRQHLSNGSDPCRIHLLVSPSPGAGTSFITEYFARYAQHATQTNILLLKVVYNSLEPHTVALENLNLEKNIVNKKGIDWLEVNVNGEDWALDSLAFNALMQKLKESQYSNVFIDLPNERDDSSYLSVLPSVDAVYVNIGYDITDKFALRHMVNVMEEQFSVKPIGAFFNLRQNEIPNFIYKRL